MTIRETNSQYHSNAAISHSKLEIFRKRPRLYQMRYVTKELPSPEPTAAFRIGSAVHCAVLEKVHFEERYALRPDGIDRRTKDGKVAWETFCSQNAGKEILDSEEWKQVHTMQTAVVENPLVSQLLSNGSPELSWRLQSRAVPVQCRTDWFSREGCALSDGRPYVADLKTVDSLDADSFRSFERSAFTFGYHRQAGFYLDLISESLGFPVTDFYFIVIEKLAPYGVSVVRLSADALTAGRNESMTDLSRLKVCLDTDNWPNVEPQVTELALPKWYN